MNNLCNHEICPVAGGGYLYCDREKGHDGQHSKTFQQTLYAWDTPYGERQKALIANALKLLADRTTHQGCEDGWYACPKSPDYIKHGDTDDAGCNCGADEILVFFAKYGLPAD